MSIVTVQLDLDKDGYTSQTCPACMHSFKLKFGKKEGSDEPIAYCPYCKAQHQMWTPEQIKYLDCVALKGAPKCKALMPKEPDEPHKNHEFSCKHGDLIKHDESQDYLYCVIDGEKFFL